MAEGARAGFRRFLKPDGEGLCDVIDGPAGDDGPVRPIQVFAVSLPHSPLPPEQQRLEAQRSGAENWRL